MGAVNLPHLEHISWVGSVHADPAQPLTAASEEIYYLNHDLSDLSVRAR